jgi:hypothetical protein
VGGPCSLAKEVLTFSAIIALQSCQKVFAAIPSTEQCMMGASGAVNR